MTKHLEIRTIEHRGVKVTIKIDYDNGTASMVEMGGFGAKKWVFAERGLAYMDGWKNILDAMQLAVKECKKELELSLAQSSAFKDETVDFLAAEIQRKNKVKPAKQ